MTLYIIKNSLNRLIFTLNESSILLSPKYILRIESKVDFKSKYMVFLPADDLSTNQARYNEWIIEEVIKDEEDLAEYKINLIPAEYNFYMYESLEDTVQPTDKVIENGKIRVIE